VKESDIDVAVRRVIRHFIGLGRLDPKEQVSYQNYGPELVDTQAARDLALHAAHEAIVLLQNPSHILPLDPAVIQHVALIGPNSNATDTLLSNYHGDNRVVGDHSIQKAMSRLIPNVMFSFGCNVGCNSTAGFADAVNTAKKAQVAIVVLGIDQNIEQEGLDRDTLTLPGHQEELIEAIVNTGVPTILVLVNGGPLALPNWLLASKVPIVEAFYPGEIGGDAVVDIIFGRVSPSGRLPYTVYPANFITRSYFDMDMRSNGGVTYMWYTGTPLWTFGWGLSYTTFNYSWSAVQPHRSLTHQRYSARKVGTGKQVIMYNVTVTNTGRRSSDTTVLGFLSSQSHSDAPIRKLFGFARIRDLSPGESAWVLLTVPRQVLALVDDQGRQAIRPGHYAVNIGDVPSQMPTVNTHFDITSSTDDGYEIFNLAKIRARSGSLRSSF